MLANMALAKGHSSKTKSQVSDIRTIDPLFLARLHEVHRAIVVTSVVRVYVYVRVRVRVRVTFSVKVFKIVIS